LIIAAAQSQSQLLVVTPNIVQLQQAEVTPVLERAYSLAHLAPPDGWPIALIVSMRMRRRIGRVTGADLVPRVGAQAVAEGIPIVVLGGAGDAASVAASRLEGSTDGLCRVNLAEPIPREELDDEVRRAALIERLVTGPSKIAFIGLSVPQREELAVDLVLAGYRGAILCVGAAVEFAAGRQSRAPLVLRGLGLEWCHRILQNPRKMAPRYMAAAPFYIRLLLQSRLGRRLEICESDSR